METTQIKQELQEYINNGDERLLKMLYALAREYNEEDSEDYLFSEEEIALFEERSNSYLKGESKGYNWETAKAIITGKK